jgi:hypothetical protein
MPWRKDPSGCQKGYAPLYLVSEDSINESGTPQVKSKAAGKIACRHREEYAGGVFMT